MPSEVAESYRAPLEELKMNSKPQISMLTMLAEDHEPNANEIVSVIQDHIHKVPATRKLPIMYLVDSIIKNLPKSSYPQMFGNVIVDIFCGVFEEVDEQTRSQLYKLRQTWVDILPNKRLYALDVQVKTIDANWPVTAKPPSQGVIHVNPKFLKQSKERSPQFSPNNNDDRNSPKSPKDDDLKEKEKEIQRLKLELEMATIKNKLEQEKKRLEEAMQTQTGKRFTHRDPPPSIQLPPAVPTPAAPTSVLKPPTSRDPRLNRDPRVNRDPRLKKQVGFQEPLGKTDNVPDTAIPQDVGYNKSPSASSSGSSIASKVDYASLLSELSNAASIVAKEKKSPPKPPSAPTSQKSKTSSSNKSEQGANVVSDSNKEKSMKEVKKDKVVKKEDKSNNSNKSPIKTKSASSSREKGSSNKDTKSNDFSSRRDRERGERKDSDRHRGPDAHDSERRTGSEGGRRSPRRGQRKSSPDYRRDNNHRDSRQNAAHSRGRSRDENKSTDGKTDQFGRMPREEKRGSRSKSRDRSPIERTKSSKEESDLDKAFDKTNTKIKKDSTIKINIRNKNSTEAIKPEQPEKKLPIESDTSEIQDVDMRNKEVPVATEVCKTPLDDAKDIRNNNDDSKENQLKRKSPKIDPVDSESEPSIPPYKIPKLSDRSAEMTNAGLEKGENESKEQKSKEVDSKKEEDISQLFGGEDVDYRKIPSGPTPLMIPPPMPGLNLLSPVTPLKSPAQQRWNQHKESHPTEYVHDMERKRLRDAQMQSIDPVEDVDMRPLARPPVQSKPPTPIPKDLCMENQKEILRTAEKKMKDGQISHAEHQEIIKQLGQVYDMQRKSNKEDTPSKSLDLKEDPRLRGMFSRDAEKSRSNPEVSQRSLYEFERRPKPMPEPMQTSPRYGEKPDEPGSSPSSPRENFIKRDLDERRGPAPNFDERSSSPKDFDERIQGSYRDYNHGNPTRREDYDRQRRLKDNRHLRRDDRDSRSPTDLLLKEDLDIRRENLDKLRGDQIRSRKDHGEFYDDPDYRNRGRRPDRPFRDSPPLKDTTELQPPPHLPQQRPQQSEFPGVPPRMAAPVRPEIVPSGPRGPLSGPVGPMPVLRVPGPMSGPLSGPMPGPVPQQNVPPVNNSAPTGPNGQRMSSEQEVVRPLPIPAVKKISDPLDDPRWAVMRGMLENKETEELVIDGKPFELRMGTSRKLRIDGNEMDVAVDLKERGIFIDGRLVYKLGEPIKEVRAMGKFVKLYYHGLQKPIWLDGQQHEMRLDAPPRNVIVDGEKRGFQIDGKDLMILVDRLEKGVYGGPPRRIRINRNEHEISFQAPPRQITIDGKACKLKLDCKIPCVIIDGKPHGIRFDGDPRPVIINDQPFIIPVDRAEKIRLGARPMYVAFGGPAHELIIDGKWFEIAFDNMPKDIHLGNRHFVIRLPGPLPKVKILDELYQNMDESRLFSNAENPQFPKPGPMPGPNMMPGGIPGPNHPIPQPVIAGNVPARMQGLPMVNQTINTQPGQQNPLGLPQMGPMNIPRPMGNPQNPALLPMGVGNLIAGLMRPAQPNLTQPPPTLGHPSVTMATGLQNQPPQGNALPTPAAPTAQPITAPNLPGLLALKSLFPPNTVVSTPVASTTAPSAAPSTVAKGPLDINSLLNNLLKVGLIKDGAKESGSSEEVKTQVSQPASENQTAAASTETPQKKSIPDLTNFSPQNLKIKRNPVIDALHEGIQCHTCATRFTMSDHEKYRAHLDWHFRQNKKEQDMMKVAKNRKWFYSVVDWIQYEELEETEEKNRSEIFEQMKFNEDDAPVPAPNIYKALEGKDVIKNPVATGAEGEDVCATCGDPFDQVWSEETEEWILKNTIKVQGKTYHPVCYEDVSETPTPAVAPQQNPLEDELLKLSSVKTEVKEEVNPSTGAASTDTAPMVPVKAEPTSAIQELSTEGRLSDLAPKLLSTIASQVQREVIPVSMEDDSSAWDMDSNPTPELSRTPTPEPIVSFTPVVSSSAESVTAGPSGHPQEEQPIPIKEEATSPKPEEIKEDSTSQMEVTVKEEPGKPDLTVPPLLEPVLPGLELVHPAELSQSVKPEPSVSDKS